jgi:hypothetical protein
MVKLVFKVLIGLVVGFLGGLLIGVIAGMFVGLAFDFFFLEAVKSDQTTLVSLLIAIISGGLIGFIGVLALKRAYETDDRAWVGAIIGAIVSLFTAYFYYGVILNPYPDIYTDAFYWIPIVYGASIGGQSGATMFSIVGMAAIIREIVQSNAELRKNREMALEQRNELSFYKSKKDDNP